MKNLEDLTIREFNEYSEILKGDDFNIFELMGYLDIKDAEKLDINEFNKISELIVNQKMNIPPLKTEYVFKDRVLVPVTQINKIKAAQFIDFQSYMVDYKLERVLSVFLLPVIFSKSFFGMKKGISNYNDGYDVIELQNFILDNFKIGDALALSGFFFNLSVKLLPIIQNSLILDLMVMKEKIRRKGLKKT